MSKTPRNQGGQAFPSPRSYQNWNIQCTPGMSLRDYFAGQALAGMATSKGITGVTLTDFAEAAYATADAMLRVRSATHDNEETSE